MKRKIRMSVFETNSSSTHSIAICTKEEYEKWKSGDLFLRQEWHKQGDFINKESVDEILKKDNVDIDGDYDLRNSDIFTFENWNPDHEESTSTYITKTGEELKIRCYYGYDG